MLFTFEKSVFTNISSTVLWHTSRLVFLIDHFILSCLQPQNQVRHFSFSQLFYHFTVCLSPKNVRWPWNGIVVDLGVDVNQDPRVSRAICTWEADSAWALRPTARHLKLVARHIELRATHAACDMQSNNFSPQQVVACSEAGGHSKGALPAVVVQRHGSPGLGRHVIAFLVDLEPNRAGAVRDGRIVDPGHVHDDWPEMVPADGLLIAGPLVGLSVHLYGYVLAGCEL